MLKKLSFILIVAIIISQLLTSTKSIIFADEFISNSDVQIYKIYDDDLNLLFEREDPLIGDNYLSKDYKFYEIVYLDNENKSGIAKYLRDVTPPKISKSLLPTPIKVEDRVICMYMTHNDESYVPTDGVDSIYGNGGIKDVALAFKDELEKYFIDVHFDDTLHIPHDSKAYTRSSVTAKKLYENYKPDAIFDIHRDGTSRSFYVTKVDGKERGRVRMVIGKANPNMELNEEFALYLMAVGNELYPWLFTDIYYAKGHYNQEIDGKAILFEMGSHLCEKELEIESMKELAEVVTTALYRTTVNTETGDLTVNGEETVTDVIVKDIIEEKQETKENNGSLVASIIIVSFTAFCIAMMVVIYKSYTKGNKTE